MSEEKKPAAYTPKYTHNEQLEQKQAGFHIFLHSVYGPDHKRRHKFCSRHNKQFHSVVILDGKKKITEDRSDGFTESETCSVVN